MSTAICNYCNEPIVPITVEGKEVWQAVNGLRKCHSGPDDEHFPYEDAWTKTKRLADDLAERNGKPRRWTTRRSSASYCSGCHNKFPTEQGYPHEQSGSMLIWCPNCKDNGKLFGETDGFNVSAAAPALDLTCDNCGDEVDAGDDNDSDPMAGPGDTCQSCGQGRLKFASDSTQEAWEMAEDVQDNAISGLESDLWSQQQDANAAPRSFKEPRKMMRGQGNPQGGNINARGETIMPKSHKNASYGDLAKHIIGDCKFCKSLWKQGFNEHDLMRVHDESHKKPGYSADHQRSVYDIEHNQMVSASKTAGEIIRPPASLWTGNPEDDEFPKSVTLTNLKDPLDWGPMDAHSSRPNHNIIIQYHQPGEFKKGIWNYDDIEPVHHGEFQKHYGTQLGRTNLDVSLNAVARLRPVRGDGPACPECKMNHGWEWSIQVPKPRILGEGSDLVPIHEPGRIPRYRTEIHGYGSTHKEAARLADEFHQQNFT